MNFDEKDLLTRELRERAGDVGGHPIDFNAVRGSAKKIRRRRNVVTGAVAAAVATVALPTGVAVNTALQSPDGAPDGSQVATTPTPEPSPSLPAPTPRPDGTFPLTLQPQIAGAPPQVPYVDGVNRAIVTDGETYPTPIAYQQATRYAGGWLAMGYEGDGEEMFLLDENMEVDSSFPSGYSFAVSNDGGHVAYIEIQNDGSQKLVKASNEGTDVQAWTFPGEPAVAPLGLVDADTVVYGSEGVEPAFGLATPEGTTPITGFVKVSDADIVNGLIVGQTRSDLVNGSCYGVMDPAVSTTKMVWETCDHALHSFSPDGRYLFGTIPDSDGMGVPTLVVVDARSHDVVVEFAADRNDPTVLFQRTWEDGDTVLGIVTDGVTYSLQRFELDGRVEQAADPVRIDPRGGDVPIWFAERRW